MCHFILPAAVYECTSFSTRATQLCQVMTLKYPSNLSSPSFQKREIIFFKSSLEDIFMDFRKGGRREREGGREKERERKRERERKTSMWEINVNRLPPLCMLLTGDQTCNLICTPNREWTHNPGMCHDRTSNPQTFFGVWDDTQADWATWSGQERPF